LGKKKWNGNIKTKRRKEKPVRGEGGKQQEGRQFNTNSCWRLTGNLEGERRTRNTFLKWYRESQAPVTAGAGKKESVSDEKKANKMRLKL